MTLATSTLATLAVLALSAATAAAYPLKEDDPMYYSRLLAYNRDNGRNLDAIDTRDESRPLFALVAKVDQAGQAGTGGSSLMRDLDMLRNRAAFFSRGNRDQDETKKQQQMAYHFMDPLMGNTIGTAKRGGYGDGPSGYPFGGQKRNMDEIDRSSFNSFNKKNFDEIDRSGFGSFVKKNFDEIDRSGFGKFIKRSVAQPDSELPQI